MRGVLIRTCKVKSCGGNYYARGYCNKHWIRWRTHGDPHFTLYMRNHNELCSVKGCSGEYLAKGYCGKHYQRWDKYGDPLIMNRAENGSGWITMKGYRKIHVNGKHIYEHRHVMEQKLGRKLKPNEIVHHKDGNGLNNEEENLEVVNGVGEHKTLHRTDWGSLTYRTCTRCGKRKRIKFFGCYKSGKQVGAYFSRCKKCRGRDGIKI